MDLRSSEAAKNYNTYPGAGDATFERKNMEDGKKGFWPLFLFFNILLIGTLILLGVWRADYGGGFDWSASTSNFHPLFLCTGLLGFYGYGIISYRVFRGLEKKTAKIIHAFIHLLAIVFSLLGVWCMWHHLPSHLSSLHSWIGFTTTLLFCLQYVCGFVTFLFPGLATPVRAWYKPNHVFWGMAIFALAVAAMLTGTMEMGDDAEARTAEAYLMNFFGLGVLATGITVIYMAVTPGYARVEQNDMQHTPLN